MMKKEIKYTKWGLANSYSDHIELNEAFKKHPKLHDYVLRHEEGHKEEFDLLHEFDWTLKDNLKMLWFCLKHPRTWVDFLPIRIIKRKIVYDLNLMIIYGIISVLLFALVIISMEIARILG